MHSCCPLRNYSVHTVVNAFLFCCCSVEATLLEVRWPCSPRARDHLYAGSRDVSCVTRARSCLSTWFTSIGMAKSTVDGITRNCWNHGVRLAMRYVWDEVCSTITTRRGFQEEHDSVLKFIRLQFNFTPLHGLNTKRDQQGKKTVVYCLITHHTVGCLTTCIVNRSHLGIDVVDYANVHVYCRRTRVVTCRGPVEANWAKNETVPCCAVYLSPVLTLTVLNFWKFTSYCNLKPLWSGMGEVVPARTSPTLHPPSPPTVHQLSWLALLRVNSVMKQE